MNLKLCSVIIVIVIAFDKVYDVFQYILIIMIRVAQSAPSDRALFIRKTYII